MDEIPPSPQILKSLIADASHSQGPTLFLICQVNESGSCEIHEQLSDGGCSIWPELYARRCLAEEAIYQREWDHFLSRPVRPYGSAGYSALGNQSAELARLRYRASFQETPVDSISPHSRPHHPLRIIVADDQEWIRIILVQVVQQTFPTAEVVETEDGLQALEAFRNGGCHFLVSNHWMPNMDGPTLIRQVRQEAPELPIVMVSTKSGARSDAVAAGANWFLAKEQIIEHLPKLLLRYADTEAKPDVMVEH